MFAEKHKDTRSPVPSRHAEAKSNRWAADWQLWKKHSCVIVYLCCSKRNIKGDSKHNYRYYRDPDILLGINSAWLKQNVSL